MKAPCYIYSAHGFFSVTSPKFPGAIFDALAVGGQIYGWETEPWFLSVGNVIGSFPHIYSVMKTSIPLSTILL
jgi:hypothetical protein